ncbi:MAG: aminotransferase class V-fold PLP-dependent enzyme [Myxococcota bacterium]
MRDKDPPLAGLDSQLVHLGLRPDPSTGAVTAPIHLSTTFARGGGDLVGDYVYSRHNNPNRHAVEVALAGIEGGAEAACFASGCAAAHALISTLHHGDRIVVGHDMYFGIRSLLSRVAPRIGLELVEVDMTQSEALESVLAVPTALVMAESPTNPQLAVVDLEYVAALAHRAGAHFLVDNTMATSICQRPLDLGADFVLHATTKYLGGHGDVLGGVLIAAAHNQRWAEVREMQCDGGAVPSPFECWLLRRSLMTLSLRVERQVDNAESLATTLTDHSMVDRLIYPGLPSHPNHAVVRRQMRRPGAMMGLLVAGGAEGARRFCSALQLALTATSLGAVHTLVEHRKPVEGPDSNTPDNLVRVSVGIETLDDLKTDFVRALDQLAS